MTGPKISRILSGRQAADFVGRKSEADRLFAHASSASPTDGMLLLSEPGAGATELLRQTYDRLFRDQRETVPFYFNIRRSLDSPRAIAESFLREFICQLIAFRRHEPAIVRSAAGLDELAELSLSVSGIWIDRLIETARTASDGREFVRTCLGAPIRAAAHGARAFVMIDVMDELLNIESGRSFMEDVKDVFDNAGVRFVLSGHRRFLHGQMDCGRVELKNLDFDEAGQLVAVLAREYGVAISEQSRDLIATQLRGNPAMIERLVLNSSDSGGRLERFEDVEKVYADSIFDGRIGREFDRMFSTICGTNEIERRVLELLADTQASERGLDREMWRRRLQIGEAAAEEILNRLNIAEFVRLTPGSVEAMPENIALSDFIDVRKRLAVSDIRASVFGDSLATYIRRGPELMAKHYRATWSIGVREVLGAFAGQGVARSLIDYAEFRDTLKGLTEDEVTHAIQGARTIALPKIFFTTAASAFYKPIAQISESERSAIALGFEARDETGDEEVVWIAAEIDSKLEATRELAEFWCDRLEAAALMCDFARFKIWLISPEGFSPDALEALKRRSAYGSSRRQIDLLRSFLNAPASDSPQLESNEYEIVIPMQDDAEIIAAHTVEEIAKRHKLDAKSINQIKTALVEACINASEHSLSPDRKIYQRFRIEEDRVVLTVSNRGLKLASKTNNAEPGEGRRGWGLKLMRKLMDEVAIEHVDDGTRIVMTKYLRVAA